MKDRLGEADAACGLGQVYQQMGEHATALRYHQMELDIAEELELLTLQSRACGNLGMVHESLGNFDEAVRYQEQHLSVAAQTNDKQGKTMAYSSLGKSVKLVVLRISYEDDQRNQLVIIHQYLAMPLSKYK